MPALDDEKLADKNLKLSGHSFLMPAFTLVPTVQTSWIDALKAPKGKKKSPPSLMASHCPFCGEKVPMPKKEDAA